MLLLIAGFIICTTGALLFTRFIKLPLKPIEEDNRPELIGIGLFILGMILMLTFIVPLLMPQFGNRGM